MARTRGKLQVCQGSIVEWSNMSRALKVRDRSTWKLGPRRSDAKIIHRAPLKASMNFEFRNNDNSDVVDILLHLRY